MVLVGIKTEIGKPRPVVPNEGYLEFFVDWYVKFILKKYDIVSEIIKMDFQTKSNINKDTKHKHKDL